MHDRLGVNLLGMFAGLLMLWGGGCGANRGAPSGINEGDPEQDAGAVAKASLPSLEKGLEYRRQVVMGKRAAAVVRGLLPYELNAEADGLGVTPSGFPNHAQRATMRANGFRLLPVPMDELAGLVESFGEEAIHDSTWLGQASDWMMLANGPAIEGTRIFSIGGDTHSYNEGEFRLLGRAYMVPFPDRTLIRLEFLPQWFFEMRNDFSMQPGAGRLAGELLGELGWALNLDGRYAAVLVCEDPLVDWAASIVAAEEAEAEAEAKDGDEENGAGDDAEAADVQPVDDSMGPEPIPIRTLGEEVLQSVDGSRRLVIIFLPHLGELAAGN